MIGLGLQDDKWIDVWAFTGYLLSPENRSNISADTHNNQRLQISLQISIFHWFTSCFNPIWGHYGINSPWALATKYAPCICWSTIGPVSHFLLLRLRHSRNQFNQFDRLKRYFLQNEGVGAESLDWCSPFPTTAVSSFRGTEAASAEGRSQPEWLSSAPPASLDMLKTLVDILQRGTTQS